MIVNCVIFPSFFQISMCLLKESFTFIHRITAQGKLSQSGNDSLSKVMLGSDRCYMLDCDDEIFVWMGKQTSVTERKTSISFTEVRTPFFPLAPLSPLHLVFSLSPYAYKTLRQMVEFKCYRSELIIRT